MADGAASVAHAASLPGREARAGGPRIGVVLPVHRQGLLLIEAIDSVLAQEGIDLHAVIVDDGCRQWETREVGRAYGAHPRVSYVRRANGGLSAARNTGVSWLLDRFPDLEAIYMLDADNRLRPHALARALAMLESSPPEVGWIYPDLDMFGVTAAFDYGGPYSRLAHRATNISEAGSLIRTSVFRAGLRFDETMRDGYEDWDFFLSAGEAGFVGRHLPGFGLQYRKRGESMLAEASRNDAGLRARIARKHPESFRLGALLSLEQEEAPRYAVFLADQGRCVFTSDPALPGLEMGLDEAGRRYWAARATPTHAHFPPFIVITSRAALDVLAARRLLHWAFWRLEKSAGETSAFAFMTMERGGEEFRVAQVDPEGGAHRGSPLLMFGAPIAGEVLEDNSSAWIDSLAAETPSPRITLAAVSLPDLPRTAFLQPVANLAAHFLSVLRRSPWRAGAALSVTWKAASTPYRNGLYKVLRSTAGGLDAAVTPWAGDGRNVGFLLPFVSFGGVEKVATETARVLKEAGFIPHLLVWGASPFQWSEAAAEPFETVHLIDDPHGLGWDDRQTFLGTALPSAAADTGAHAAVIGALGWLDAVINCHSVGGHALMGRLRAMGVRTFVHTHVHDRTSFGRPAGHPALAVAYEHAYDGVIACSNTLGDWLAAMGTPSAKLIRAPNAPGYPLAPEAVESRLAARRARTKDEPLRALFLGRLDRQKGLDRLMDVIQGARGCQWRVAGRPVLSDGREVARLRQLGVAVEPPASDAGALTELYAWADVLVLLSHWEGLPLTVLEAQRLGCVPVVTDVGAVSEAVEDGVNGVLIADDPRAATAAISALETLAGDRERLARLSGVAADRARGRTWSHALQPLVAALR